MEGKRYQSLLWKLSTDERHFDDKLREARQRRDATKERKEQENAEQRLQGKGEEMIRERREGGEEDGEGAELHDTENFILGEFEGDGLEPIPNWGEEEWNQDQRRLLLELGLAVEWTNEYPSDEEEGGGDGETDDEVPVLMGLKLLR